ncbi:MAG: glycosyltransferase family 1 protein [Phycisphaerae bacterium]|nr:glycosyltransferase family 1 protein [Phycisphaerae bacterium]
MQRSLRIVTAYDSAFEGLSCLAGQIARAAAAAGHAVNSATEPQAFLWLNHLPDRLLPAGGAVARTQYLVDHPLALDPASLDRLAQSSTFRLLTATPDGQHLLRLRWPRLAHAVCRHAVDDALLCDPATIEPSHTLPPDRGGRPVDVLLSASIRSQPQIDDLYEHLAPHLRTPAREIARILSSSCRATFESAADLALSDAGSLDWRTLAGLWLAATADANRQRRLRTLAALQGLPVRVHGPSAWAAHCTGTIEFAGPLPMHDLPAQLARAKVCLALGPTQFTLTHSERLLMALAAGCAAVADDRPLTRCAFAPEGSPPAVALFDADEPGSLRDTVDRLLAGPSARSCLAAEGRRSVAREHLWSHRLPALLGNPAKALAAAA